jgi:hypothetical protein
MNVQCFAGYLVKQYPYSPELGCCTLEVIYTNNQNTAEVGGIFNDGARGGGWRGNVHTIRAIEKYV